MSELSSATTETFVAYKTTILPMHVKNLTKLYSKVYYKRY